MNHSMNILITFQLPIFILSSVALSIKLKNLSQRETQQWMRFEFFLKLAEIAASKETKNGTLHTLQWYKRRLFIDLADSVKLNTSGK